jgi:hypothetical protein
MFLKNRKLLPIVLLVLIFSSVLSGSARIIYHLEGCWPEFGDLVTSTGKYLTLATTFIIAYYFSKYRNWIGKGKSTNKNRIGYSGGLVVAAIAVLSVFFIIHGVIWYYSYTTPFIVNC